MTNQFIHSIALIIITAVSSREASAGNLGSGFPLMMEISDSRLLSLGGAALTEVGRTGIIAHNPASIFNGEKTASVSYSKQPVDIWNSRLLGSGRYNELDFAIYLQTYGFGSFDRSETGQGKTGESFDASENLLGLGIAGDLFGRGSWGIAGKVDWIAVDGEIYSAIAFDAGLTFNPRWEKTGLGLSLRNIGTEIAGKSGLTTTTPTELSLSLSKRLNHLPLTLFSAVHLRRNGEGDVNLDMLRGSPGLAYGLGGEFEVFPAGAEKPFHLRFGYRSLGQGFRVGTSSDTFAGFSFGLGLFIRQISVDYAFASLGALGNVHKLGISKSF